MALVSMETDEGDYGEPISDKYGYGLKLHLNDDQTEALGIKQPLRAGTKVKIAALAFVANVTESVENDGDDTGNDINLCLQITHMELSPGMESNAAQTLYGKP